MNDTPTSNDFWLGVSVVNVNACAAALAPVSVGRWLMVYWMFMVAVIYIVSVVRQGPR